MSSRTSAIYRCTKLSAIRPTLSDGCSWPSRASCEKHTRHVLRNTARGSTRPRFAETLRICRQQSSNVTVRTTQEPEPAAHAVAAMVIASCSRCARIPGLRFLGPDMVVSDEPGPILNRSPIRRRPPSVGLSSTHRGPSDLPKAAVHIAYRLLRRIRSVEAKIQHSDSQQRLRVVLEWESS
jgi:hypothetical protein